MNCITQNWNMHEAAFFPKTGGGPEVRALGHSRHWLVSGMFALPSKDGVIGRRCCG